MVVEDLNEAVPVRADFSGGTITPRAFRRGERTCTIDRVNARWVDRDGSHACYHFSVEAGGDVYFLTLRAKDMVWRLEKVVMAG
jgi:hypothetical protein